MNVEIRNLRKRFGDAVIFQDFNMSFPLGQITVLMGPSGVGKTTLLNILMGLTRPESGEISALPAAQSAVFQEDRLIAGLSAIGNVALCCSRSREEIAAHLQRVGLDGLDRPARELSGGMARRVAVVRACLAPSDIIFMDEPLSGLDAATARRVIDYILEARGGRTLLAVLHDAAHAERLGGFIRRMESSGQENRYNSPVPSPD